MDTNYTVSVLDYKGFFKLIYGNGGMPKDRSVYKRIRFFSVNDFNWNQESEVKPYFFVLQFKNKVIGLAKIGQYSNDNFHEKDYSLAFLSIDIRYRGKGFTRIIADKLFEFLKEKDFELKTSRYTYVGKLKLQKILNDMAVKWQVKFTDREETDYITDSKDDYDENLIHRKEKEDV